MRLSRFKGIDETKTVSKVKNQLSWIVNEI